MGGTLWFTTEFCSGGKSQVQFLLGICMAHTLILGKRPLFSSEGQFLRAKVFLAPSIPRVIRDFSQQGWENGERCLKPWRALASWTREILGSKAGETESEHCLRPWRALASWRARVVLGSHSAFFSEYLCFCNASIPLHPFLSRPLVDNEFSRVVVYLFIYFLHNSPTHSLTPPSCNTFRHTLRR